VLGDLDSGLPGPLFVATGGLHGNEPAGLEAIERVFRALASGAVPFRGRVVGVAGNLGALGKGVRFLDRDLNRRWFPRELSDLVHRPDAHTGAEDSEQRELAEFYARLLREHPGTAVFLDLHTTSADAPPFVAFADDPENLRHGRSLPIPNILGLAEVLDGPMLSYFHDLGHACIVVEGGRHTDPGSADRLESAFWLLLQSAGCIDGARLPDRERHRRRLRDAARGAPRLVEIRYRHGISAADEFRMDSGFRSFQPVAKGDRLAQDRSGPIFAPLTGVLLMPLYQGQGEDGFFLARTVGRLHLGALLLLRRMRAERLLPLHPAVARHDRAPDAFVVDLRRAGKWTVGLLHLLGYRRIRPEGERFLFSRRASLPE